MICYREQEPRNGSWRICEKVSVSTISRRPGDRTWNDLLGQQAKRPVDAIDHVTGQHPVTADTFDYPAAAFAGNAAFLAADPVGTDSVLTDSLAVSDSVAVADSGYNRS